MTKLPFKVPRNRTSNSSLRKTSKKPVNSITAKTIECLTCDGTGKNEEGFICSECAGKGTIKVTIDRAGNNV